MLEAKIKATVLGIPWRDFLQGRRTPYTEEERARIAGVGTPEESQPSGSSGIAALRAKYGG